MWWTFRCVILTNGQNYIMSVRIISVHDIDKCTSLYIVLVSLEFINCFNFCTFVYFVLYTLSCNH